MLPELPVVIWKNESCHDPICIRYEKVEHSAGFVQKLRHITGEAGTTSLKTQKLQISDLRFDLQTQIAD